MKLFLSLVVLSLLSTAARAEDKPAAEGVMPWEKACAADMKKICPEVKGDIRACLADHEEELSKECTKHFSAAGYRVAKLCEADFEKLCPGAAQNGTLSQCLEKKVDKLSPRCKQALTAPSGGKKAVTKKDKAKKSEQPAK